MNEHARRRILEQVKLWAHRRGIATSPEMLLELAALVAHSEANGIDDASSLRREQFDSQVKGLQEIGAEFRKEADIEKEREL